MVAVVDALIDLGGLFYGPLRFAAPLIKGEIWREANKLKSGLTSGTIVPDGHGGYVPVDNSKYDPKTGRFL